MFGGAAAWAETNRGAATLPAASAINVLRLSMSSLPLIDAILSDRRGREQTCGPPGSSRRGAGRRFLLCTLFSWLGNGGGRQRESEGAQIRVSSKRRQRWSKLLTRTAR